MASSLIELLKDHVLAPFTAEQRDAMVSWMEHEIETRPLIDNLTSEDGVNWVLGENSPGNEGATVFAMLHHETMRAIIIYSVAITPDPAAGGTRFEYFREVCYNPKHQHGPISGPALFLDFREFVAVDLEQKDAGGGQPNGAALAQ